MKMKANARRAMPAIMPRSVRSRSRRRPTRSIRRRATSVEMKLETAMKTAKAAGWERCVDWMILPELQFRRK